jgi:hypothetical protein
MRRRLEEAWVVQENVTRFKTEILEELLADKYSILTSTLHAHLLGWPVVRDRQYCLLMHRDKGGYMSRSLQDLPAVFSRNCELTWPCPQAC